MFIPSSTINFNKISFDFSVHTCNICGATISKYESYCTNCLHRKSKVSSKNSAFSIFSISKYHEKNKAVISDDKNFAHILQKIKNNLQN